MTRSPLFTSSGPRNRILHRRLIRHGLVASPPSRLPWISTST